MPSYRFFLLSLGFIVASCISAPGWAADWPTCEKAKLRQLNMEQARTNQRGGAKKSRSSTKSRRSAEQIDEWLWRNCRDYSYELRNLEQQRM